MNKFSFSLTSIGGKILSFILTTALLSLTAVFLVNYDEVPWYAIGFSLFVLLLCLFGCFLSFNHRIVLDCKQKLLKIHLFRTTKIKIKDIYDIKVDTINSINPKKYAFIVIILNNGEVYKTASLSKINNFNSVTKTEAKIKLLNQKIKEII